MELGLQAVPQMGESGCFLLYVQSLGRRFRLRIRDNRRKFCPGSPSRTGRKRGTQSQVIGGSRGGVTTKITALADALGNLTDFRLLPGQAHDLRGTAALIVGLTCGQFLTDRAFDANRVREALSEARIEAVIPPKSNRRFPAEFDRDTYKWQHLTENFFAKLKEYSGIAMRCCKTDTSYSAFIAIAATVNLLK
jgi:transposase